MIKGFQGMISCRNLKIALWLVLQSVGVHAVQFESPQTLVAAGRSYTPHIGYGSDATWLIIAQSRGTLPGINTSESDIVILRSSDQGLSWSSPATLFDSAASDTAEDGDPRFVTDGQGNWILTYLTREISGIGSGNDLDLVVTRSADNGVTWTPPAFLNSNALTDGAGDARVELATDGTGNVIAVWQSASVINPASDYPDIAFSRSTNNGQTWSPLAALDTNAASDTLLNFTPHIATDGQGRWIAVWSSNDTLGGTAGSDSDIVFSTSLDNGSSWSPAAALNASATTDATNDSEPRITCDAAGNWLVVWYATNAGTGTDSDIFYSRSVNGTSWSTPQVLNKNALFDQGGDVFPRIETDQHGNWLVYWCSSSNLTGSGTTDTNIVFAVSTDAGATWSAPSYLNTDAASDARDDYNCDIVTDGAGLWVATWGLVGGANPGPILNSRLEASSFQASVSTDAWMMME